MNLIAEFASWFFGRIGDAITPQDPTPMNPTLPPLLVEIAESQLGITESSKNHGEGIAKFWEATNYPDGYANREPYCAAAVCWIVRSAMGESIAWSFKRPQSATAFGFEDWSLKQDASTQTEPVHCNCKSYFDELQSQWDEFCH